MFRAGSDIGDKRRARVLHGAPARLPRKPPKHLKRSAAAEAGAVLVHVPSRCVLRPYPDAGEAEATCSNCCGLR
eukprot:2156951-Alexandrium_andersonii.AAC.1